MAATVLHTIKQHTDRSNGSTEERERERERERRLTPVASSKVHETQSKNCTRCCHVRIHKIPLLQN